MLELTIPSASAFDEETSEFLEVKKDVVLQLEHSLISIKKWEQIYQIPFLGKDEKTYKQIIDYVRCMTINKVNEPDVYRMLKAEQIKQVIDYIHNPMTATWFNEQSLDGMGMGKRGEIVTSEIVYYWMVTLNIPVEFERWHLNQLIALIKVINIKNGKEKKMSKKEAAAYRSKLNQARRAKMHSKG